MGAALAIEDANAHGGYKDKPFRLVPRWSDDPWRGGASAVAKPVFTDRGWAIPGRLVVLGINLDDTSEDAARSDDAATGGSGTEPQNGSESDTDSGHDAR